MLYKDLGRIHTASVEVGDGGGSLMFWRNYEALADCKEAAAGEHRESQHDLAPTPSCSK